MKKNNHAARAARLLVYGDVKSSYLKFWRQHSSESFILCLCIKTIRAKQARVYYAYFVKRDQHGMVAKQLA